MAANCNEKSSKTQYTEVSKIEMNFVQFGMPNPTINLKLQMHSNL